MLLASRFLTLVGLKSEEVERVGKKARFIGTQEGYVEQEIKHM
jgi:hypothetical protein